ncbi:hypothetical protein DESPIG_01472 [Desulfovibrio piger ATCC 29098]|uniref:Uncharacterized protein n=1 Tax=Desulfovibrio piger ATCC 29098 TaxID=411464 RepID=B6WTR5_9BACT|nr:hypothetical protein DESPIG_01472 [Desulfovibrio piger ATCC 29098]
MLPDRGRGPYGACETGLYGRRRGRAWTDRENVRMMRGIIPLDKDMI